MHHKHSPGRFSVLLAGAVFTSVLPMASADVITHTDTIPITTTAWSDSVTIPQFDPSMGPLTGVRIKVTGDLLATLSFESLDNAPSSVTVTLDTTVNILHSDQTSMTDVMLQATGQASVAPYDGTLDFGDASGATFPNLTDTNSVTMDFFPPTQSMIDEFVGAPGNPGTVTLPVMAAGICQSSGTANVVTQCTNSAGAEVTVTYFFGSDCERVSRRKPGSLLLFPEFDNRAGMRTLFSVTNTNTDSRVDPDTLKKGGTIDVHYIYIGRFGTEYTNASCEEFDRMERLTPNDTVTNFTSDHNPQQELGYAYAYAVDSNGNAVSFNHLIGQQLRVDGLKSSHYAINAVDFRAIGAEGEATDVDEDGIRDLNGTEYEMVPEEVFIPRFIGQNVHNQSEAIFIGLSGGTAFTTTTSILLYNDNEQVFSANHTFKCWDRTTLLNISNAFSNEFLETSTNHDWNEGLGRHETGWYKVSGIVANSYVHAIHDPSVYVVHLAGRARGASADLPFEGCGQAGHLLPSSVTGDNEE